MAKSATLADAKGMSNIGEQMKSWPQRTKTFYSDVRTEMKKVTTPSRKEVQATTVVVLITVAIFGVFFWVVDLGIGRTIDQVLRYFSR